jgi:hypothetical protein
MRVKGPGDLLAGLARLFAVAGALARGFRFARYSLCAFMRRNQAIRAQFNMPK